MGCNQVKEGSKNPVQNGIIQPPQIDPNTPTLILTFEGGNEEQKNYCLQFKSELHPKNSLKFKISSSQASKFAIIFQRVNQEPIYILDNYDKSEETKNNAMNQIYNLLDGQANLNPINSPIDPINPISNPEPQQVAIPN